MQLRCLVSEQCGAIVDLMVPATGTYDIVNYGA
jgi:hypothetical protein